MRGFNSSNLRKLIGRPRRLLLAALVCGVAAFAVFNHTATGQRRRFRGLEADRAPRRMFSQQTGYPETGGEFTFARAIYDSPYSPYNRWLGGSWTVDFPEADEHFIVGVREWAGTNLNISSRPEQVKLLDQRLFDYPFLYMVEPGFLELSPEEAARLREYIMRGGFLFLDDFHGDYEWENVRTQLEKVLPEYKIVDLPLTHPIFHSYLDVEEVLQVPGIGSYWYRGVTHEKGGVTPHYMGIEDKSGRLVVFITRNCDFGDAWEHIDDSRYPVKYGLAAYKVGLNVVIYAMTH